MDDLGVKRPDVRQENLLWSPVPSPRYLVSPIGIHRQPRLAPRFHVGEAGQESVAGSGYRREPGNMRRDRNRRVSPEGRVGGKGLLLEHVESASGQGAPLERLGERRFFDQGPPSHVDEIGAAARQQPGPVEEMEARFGERTRQDEPTSARHRLLEPADREYRLEWSPRGTPPGNAVHPGIEPEERPRDASADRPGSDHDRASAPDVPRMLRFPAAGPLVRLELPEPLGYRQGPRQAVLSDHGAEVLGGAGDERSGRQPGPEPESIHARPDAVNPSKLPPGAFPGRPESHEHLGPLYILGADLGGIAGPDLKVGAAGGYIIAEPLVQVVRDQDAPGKPAGHGPGK